MCVLCVVFAKPFFQPYTSTPTAASYMYISGIYSVRPDPLLWRDIVCGRRQQWDRKKMHTANFSYVRAGRKKKKNLPRSYLVNHFKSGYTNWTHYHWHSAAGANIFQLFFPTRSRRDILYQVHIIHPRNSKLPTFWTFYSYKYCRFRSERKLVETALKTLKTPGEDRYKARCSLPNSRPIKRSVNTRAMIY